MANPLVLVNRAPRFALAAVLVLAPLAACSKTDDASKAAAVPPLPAGSAPAPAPAPAAAPTPPPPPPPPPAPAAAAEPPPDPNAKITGIVTLAGSMKSHVSPGDTLFLVARRLSDTPGIRGSLVAVKKLSAAKFPIAFEMSAADMPFQGGAFDGELTLSIRDDKDNDPMTRLKGDVFGTLPKVKVGARNVKLALDQLQKEDESLTGGNPHAAPMGGMPPGHP
jgi:hypothetical protein